MSVHSATNKRTHENPDSPPPEPGPQTKRPRQEEPKDGLCRDQEFWEEDGNILLIAGNVEFRIYKGILAHHSPFFAAMFSLPQLPAGDVSTSESATVYPAVHLSESSEDLRHVLRAILPRKQSRVVHCEVEKLSFHTISAYARLGHKYQIDALVVQTTEFLTKHFDDDFDRWQKLKGCLSALPAALAVCCTLEYHELLHGFKREDGSEEKLHENDLLRCLQGKSRLIKEYAAAIVAAFDPGEHEKNLKHAPCSLALRTQLTTELAYHPHILARGHPFEGFEHILNWGAACEDCESMLIELFSEGRLHIWRRLPNILDIDLEVDRWGQEGSTEQ